MAIIKNGSVKILLKGFHPWDSSYIDVGSKDGLDFNPPCPDKPQFSGVFDTLKQARYDNHLRVLETDCHIGGRLDYYRDTRGQSAAIDAGYSLTYPWAVVPKDKRGAVVVDKAGSPWTAPDYMNTLFVTRRDVLPAGETGWGISNEWPSKVGEKAAKIVRAFELGARNMKRATAYRNGTNYDTNKHVSVQFTLSHTDKDGNESEVVVSKPWSEWLTILDPYFSELEAKLNEGTKIELKGTTTMPFDDPETSWQHGKETRQSQITYRYDSMAVERMWEGEKVVEIELDAFTDTVGGGVLVGGDHDLSTTPLDEAKVDVKKLEMKLAHEMSLAVKGLATELTLPLRPATTSNQYLTTGEIEDFDSWYDDYKRRWYAMVNLNNANADLAQPTYDEAIRNGTTTAADINAYSKELRDNSIVRESVDSKKWYEELWDSIKGIGNYTGDLIKDWGPTSIIAGWAGYEAVSSAKKSNIPMWLIVGGAGLVFLAITK